MKILKHNGKNRVTFIFTERKPATKIKAFLQNSLPKIKYYLYKRKGKSGSIPPKGIYYIFKAGYSNSYLKRKLREGIFLNKYTYYSFTSDLGYPTPKKVQLEIINLINEYDNNFDSFIGDMFGSDFENEKSRLVSITINFVL
jgi:hypothetical protein